MHSQHCNIFAPIRFPKTDGRLVYTQLLNTRGGIECDLTIARLAADHFYIVTGTGFRTHDFHWIEDHIPAGIGCASSSTSPNNGERCH